MTERLQILSVLLARIRKAAIGASLERAMRRNDEAAAQLDAAVKEALGK